MPGIFDLLMAARGAPDPSQQLAASLGQGAGQPGSPQGPQPLAGPNAPPGSPAGPGGPPGASGGSPAPQAPPQPQVYQSPPDLAQAYMQLSQRDQASNQFYNGLALLSAGMYPGRNPNASMRWAQGLQQDPNSMFNALVQLQQMQQSQGRYNDLVQNSDKYAKAFGVDPDMFKATITAAGPQGAGDILGKIASAQMGITGSQTDKEYKQAIRNFQAANPGQPLPPELQTEAGFQAKQSGDVQASDAKAKDLVADQHNFAPALSNYDKGIGLVDQFMTPEMQEGAKEFLGTGGSMRPVATMTGKGKAAWALYKQIMATQFSAGTQDFKGAGRITQQELTQDAPSQSTMGQLNQDPNDFFAGVQKYRDQLSQHRANLFGAAQKGDDQRLSDEDYTKYVAPNQDVFGGPKRNIPDFSKMRTADADAAYDALPSGKVFIDTDGTAKKKP